MAHYSTSIVIPNDTIELKLAIPVVASQFHLAKTRHQVPPFHARKHAKDVPGALIDVINLHVHKAGGRVSARAQTAVRIPRHAPPSPET